MVAMVRFPWNDLMFFFDFSRRRKSLEFFLWSSWCWILFYRVGFQFWYKSFQFYLFFGGHWHRTCAKYKQTSYLASHCLGGCFIVFNIHKCLGPEDIPIKSNQLAAKMVNMGCFRFLSLQSLSTWRVYQCLVIFVDQKPHFSNSNWHQDNRPSLSHFLKAGRFGLILCLFV